MNPGAATDVVLQSFPVRLFAAGREQWEGMLREYALRGFGGVPQAYDDAEVTSAGHALATVDLAVPEDDREHVDLRVPVTAPGAFAVLQGILDDVVGLAESGELLVFPPLPEVVALRNWICEEVMGQAAGASPQPWRFEALDLTAPVEGPRWDADILPPADVAWILGDDHNRIVDASPAALALLGWDATLVGQRLLAVIPPQLREAHVAGFTRSVVGGGGSLLGTPISVPALARDGREVPIVLTLTRHDARGGRAVYLARMVAEQR